MCSDKHFSGRDTSCEWRKQATVKQRSSGNHKVESQKNIEKTLDGRLL